MRSTRETISGHRREVTLQLGCDVSLRSGRKIRGLDSLGEVVRALLEGLDVALVSTEHEILLVTAHHEHSAREQGILELLQPSFYGVDGCAKRTAESEFLVQPQLDFGLLHVGKFFR